jgi:uncharacterized protein YdbL (DUF1318 family)
MNFSRHRMAASLALLLASPMVAQDPPAPVDVRSELRDRMKARYPLLDRLRDAGKLGETGEGEAKLVQASHAGEKADPQDPAKGTVGEVMAAENVDRKALYVLLARELKLTAVEVARQNGLRNIDKAKPDHWIEVKGQWVQRKSVKPTGTGK